MKFKNSIFVDEKFMETIQKCNEYEDWEPKGAYWFNRLVKKLRSAQEDFEDTRLKLVTKFADEPDFKSRFDDNGKIRSEDDATYYETLYRFTKEVGIDIKGWWREEKKTLNYANEIAKQKDWEIEVHIRIEDAKLGIRLWRIS